MSSSRATTVEDDAADADDAGSSARSAEARDEPCADVPLPVRIEALLASTDKPISEARLAALLGIETKGAAKRVAAAVEELNEAYDAAGRAIRAERLAGGWQLLTRSTFGPLLARLHAERQQTRLSQAAMETLAIVAYRQPMMRAELEAIRGVACGEVLRGLLERRLIKITGRAEELGRPMLYGTTKEFLNVFGLAGLEDLPDVQGLARRSASTTPAAGSAPDAADAAGSPEPDAAVAPEPSDAETASSSADASDEETSRGDAAS